MFVQIPGYARYLIDDQGVVVSTHKGKWKVLKPFVQQGSGYLRVDLCASGKVFKLSVHRLVLLAFVGHSSLEVNHKNGVKTDNRLENLEYCTSKENTAHSYANNLQQTKFSKALLAEVVSAKGTMSHAAAAKKFRLSKAYVGHLWKGKHDV
jgi:hypothetical protein